MQDALGDRMKRYESAQTERFLLPLIPIMARIDGRHFSSFTKGLQRPFDPGLTNLMIETTMYLVKETNANMGYTQSDEISLTWYSSDPHTELFFNGKIQKMESILASMSTAYFMYHIWDNLPKGYAEKLPHFDARVWNVPTIEEGANCFLWRESDATKNSISMAAQHYYSHKELMNKNGAEKQEMLFQKGVNWNNYPDSFKRGSYIQKRKITRPFTTEELSSLPPQHEAHRNPSLEVNRTEYLLLTMPPLSRVLNRASVIYNGEDPIISSLEV